MRSFGVNFVHGFGSLIVYRMNEIPVVRDLIHVLVFSSHPGDTRITRVRDLGADF